MIEAQQRILPRRPVLGVDITLGSYGDLVDRICQWGTAHRSSYVCCVNAHMTVEAHDDPAFAAVVNGADMATADGMPVVKSVAFFHRIAQERVAGNDLMPSLLRAAEERGLSVYLHGGRRATLDRIAERIRNEHPALRLVGTCSPPYRAATEQEMVETAQEIDRSGAHVVMVSLGCPKQEKWMAAMKGRVNAVMIGLGGAFLLYAGEDTRAPKWMRDLSLEWLYRLWLEPGRLWKRYLFTNTRFVLLFLRAWLKEGRPR